MTFNIISAACFSLVFVNYARVYETLRLNFKPFNCEACLPFWVCLALEIYQQQSFSIQMVFDGCIAVVLTLLIRSYVRPAGH